MKIEDFKSGHYEKGYKYDYFVPEKVNHDWAWDDPSLSVLLENASIKLGELNSIARIVPDIDLFIHMHINKESVISSRIEGTKTNIEEALFPIDEIMPEKIDDWNEVRNYTTALDESINRLNKLPLSTPLLKESHKILMQGVRGEKKHPGEFRKSQNWIGGVSLSNAVLIPPAHHLIEELMSDLEKFIHNERVPVPQLIKIAIAHYQFETIHPFLDGNGRIGRLMITLFMVEKKILDKPLLYLSYFFEKNKNLYYDNLTKVRTENDLLRWLKYFLIGIEEVSKQSIKTLKDIFLLKEKIESEIYHWRRRYNHAHQLLKFLFQNPVVKIKDVQRVTNLSKKAAGDLVNAFEEKNYISEITGNTRNKIFLFKPYTELFNND
jgi:Fic family protein